MTQDIERFKRIEELFEAVILLPLSKRDDYLEESCEGDTELRREVEDLLDEDLQREADVPTVGILHGINATEKIPVFNETIPSQIGRCRIIRECGRGGMGSVYEAVRDQPQRRVAESKDNCPSQYNPDQADADGNGVGNLCEPGLN